MRVGQGTDDRRGFVAEYGQTFGSPSGGVGGKPYWFYYDSHQSSTEINALSGVHVNETGATMRVSWVGHPTDPEGGALWLAGARLPFGDAAHKSSTHLGVRWTYTWDQANLREYARG